MKTRARGPDNYEASLSQSRKSAEGKLFHNSPLRPVFWVDAEDEKLNLPNFSRFFRFGNVQTNFMIVFFS